MSRMTLSRVGLALSFAAVLSLAPSPSQAATGHAPRPQPAHAPSSASFLTQAVHHLVSVFSRVGSVIDPNGVSVAARNAPPTTTIGPTG
jgi:hypothetical protein